MKIATYPQPEQIQSLLESTAEGPVVMVNLLKFRDRAEKPDEGLTGEEAYRLYGRPMRELVESRGARLLWAGRIESFVLGESDVEFDMVAIVEYPSREAFAQIATDPRVAEIGIHRAAGLEGQWLLASTTVEDI